MIALVVYTGKETKLSLNSKSTPSKLSSVDRIVNRTLVVAIGTLSFGRRAVFVVNCLCRRYDLRLLFVDGVRNSVGELQQ